jgi:beta-lactamase class A
MSSAKPPSELMAILTREGGAVGFAARHMQTGSEHWGEWNARRGFRAASLIKLPIAAAFWEAVERGMLDAEERVELRPEAAVGGCGLLRHMRVGLSPTLADLAFLMLAASDNWATNLLLDHLGIEYVQAWIDDRGLAATRLQRRMMDVEAARAGRDNWTCAADVVELLDDVNGSAIVDAEGRSRVRDALEAQVYRERLGRRLPPYVQLANKSGTLDGLCHDAGLLSWPGEDLAVVVLTEGIAPAWRAADMMADVALELLRTCGSDTLVGYGIEQDLSS